MGQKKKKKKTESSSTIFKFQANDPLVTENLNAQEIGAVKTWQLSSQYSFEYHEGHVTGGGKPLYIRPTSGINYGEMGIPKLNTFQTPKGTYSVISKIENDEKLTNNLDNIAQAELLKIIKDEWDTLVLLTKRYWDNESPPQVATVRRNMTCQKCRSKISGDVDVGEANEFGKYDCPKCKKTGCVVSD